MRGLNWQVVNLPFGAGLKQSADARARPQPYLDIARDIQFDEDLGIQTRLPYAAGSIGNAIAGGGTLTNCRRLFVDGDELCVLTKDSLYTYDAHLSQWVSRATHLAVKVTEQTRHQSTGDANECDRAELGNVIVHVWSDATLVYGATTDKTTGAIIVAPTAIAGADPRKRPRLVALSTKILLFSIVTATADLKVVAINPSDPATGLASGGTTALAGVANDYYDAVKIPGSDSAVAAVRRTVTTSYEIMKVSNSASVTATFTKARTCDGPIAVSCDPTGTSVQVVRGNGTNVQGDLITISSLADSITGQAIGTAVGTPINQIAAAHRSVQDAGAYRCYVFWSAQQQTGSLGFLSKVNYVDTGGGIGTQGTFVTRLGIASRAFDHDGRIYVHGAFAGESSSIGAGTALGMRGQLQNSYFLYRDDALLVAKAAFGRAEGFASSTGHLPGVALTSGSTTYSWCGCERRIIPLGNDSRSGYGARAPRDLVITFDSDDARRTARIGLTTYLSGGEIKQYDGTDLVEVGWHIYPWILATVDFGAGAIGAGTYSYKATLRWINARGEQERSTTATGEQLTLVANRRVTYDVAVINVTHKATTRRLAAMEFWRSAANPTPDAPFYLTTSKDPASTGDNKYLTNDPAQAFTGTAFDNFADATLVTKETNPENESILESLAPPAASIIIATDTRVFLGGVAGDPDRVWYSRQRSDGEVVSFHDALTVAVPRDGGDITAIAARADVLYVWRETALYAFPGVGIDNLGQGQNFGPVQIVSTDVGCMNAEAVALTDRGYVFKSRKGWFVLVGTSLEYIGDAVSDYDSETITSIDVLEAQHQIRCLSSSRMLVFDTRVGQWAELAISDGLDSCVWQGLHTYLTSTGPKQQGTAYTGLTYGLDVETAWIKLADLQGAAAVRLVQPIGEFRSAHYLRVRIAYNYKYTNTPAVPEYIDDRSWQASPSSIAGSVLQFRHGPKRPRCQSIKVRLSALAGSTIATATDLTATVQLSVGNWTATVTGVAPRALSVGGVVSTTASVEIRDNERWDGVTWVSAPNNCGVKINGNNTTATVTIATVEAAINATSRLCQVTIAHGSPGATVDLQAGKNIVDDYVDAGFPVAYPTGEALKLTGLALEVGSEGGVYRALPKAQLQ